MLINNLAAKYPYVEHPPTAGAEIISMQPSGLIIFSKIPLTRLAFREFTKGTGLEKISRKGNDRCAVDQQGRGVALFNTHLQAGRNQDPAIRVDQLRECREFMREFTNNDDAAVVLAGDFNIDSSALSAYRQIFEQLDGAQDSYDDGRGPIKGKPATRSTRTRDSTIRSPLMMCRRR